MTPPTARQLEIYAWMLAYQREQGAPPSIREIGAHFGIRSPNCVSGHLVALSKKELVRRGPRSWAAIAPPSALAAEVLRVDRMTRTHRFSGTPTPEDWRKLVALAQAEGGAL